MVNVAEEEVESTVDDGVEALVYTRTEVKGQ
jgi:hypothetical protein